MLPSFRNRTTQLPVFIMASIFFVAGLSVSNASKASEKRLIAVEGEARFEIPADIIIIDFSVSNLSHKVLSQAKASVDTTSSKLAQALINFGIQEDDIVATEYRITAEPNRHERLQNKDQWLPIVSRQFQLTLRDISRFNALLDTLVNNGVTRIIRTQGELDNRQKHERQAMTEAIEDATATADFQAKAFGAQLGKVHSINRSNTRMEPRMLADLSRASEYAQGGKTQELPYEFKPAPIKIHAQIYAEFELK